MFAMGAFPLGIADNTLGQISLTTINIPGNFMKTRSVSCFLCGSFNTSSIPYLQLNSNDLKRNIAYSLPRLIANILCAVSKRFSAAYYPVAVNKKFFNRSAIYCRDCRTGSCQPGFENEQLTNYYQKFYWNNRDNIDGQHISVNGSPNDQQLRITTERIKWIDQFLPTVWSVIDFGGGDCAAAFVFKKRSGSCSVHVVDPSVRARAYAAEYGVGYSDSIEQAPVVDLIYSAHSIEHVANFLGSIGELLKKVRLGGHIFFKTPNIGDQAVFEGLCHTPHTFMLSAQSFVFLEKIFPIKIIAVDCSGPEWKRSRKKIVSNEKADLRILLQKTGEVYNLESSK